MQPRPWEYPSKQETEFLSSWTLYSNRTIRFSSVAQSSPTLCDPMIAACQASLSITISRSSLRLASIESVPQSSPSPPAPNPSQHQSLFQRVNSLHEVAKPGVQLQHHSLQRNPRADLLQNGLVGSPAVQGTLKRLLQHHSSKASILRHSAFFTVRLSHPYMTTGKNIALTRQTLADRVMSLLLNMLSRLLITFLLRSKHL